MESLDEQAPLLDIPVASDYLTNPSRVDKSFWFDSRTYEFTVGPYTVISTQLARNPSANHPRQYRQYSIYKNGVFVGAQLSFPSLGDCASSANRKF